MEPRKNTAGQDIKRSSTPTSCTEQHPVFIRKHTNTSIYRQARPGYFMYSLELLFDFVCMPNLHICRTSSIWVLSCYIQSKKMTF